MQRRFVTLDVFTAQRFAGNPLAVVLDGQGLGDAAMQTVAREFNLSETVFILPPALPAHRAKIRIFTPASELPFAGHPTVGTAVLLALLDGKQGSRSFVLELGVGPVSCRVEVADAMGASATFDLPRLPADVGAPADDTAIAAALGIAPQDIGFGAARPARWSAGAPYTIVPLAGLDAMRRCRADLGAWDRAFGFDAHAAAYMVCRETLEPGSAFHTRMFAPRQGVPEDPATGSAAASLAGYIVRTLRPSDGTHSFVIEQGDIMGRPSRLALTIAVAGGELTAASIGGHAVRVSEGFIEA